MWLVWRALLAFLILPGVVAFLVPWLIVGRRWPDNFNSPGLVPLVLGTGLLFWCVVAFYREGRGTLAPWDPPQRLVVTGVYALSRNPMYVAVALILWGWAQGFESWALAAYAVVVVLAFHVRVVFGEEPWLQRRHAEHWVRYRARVPRWLGPVRRASMTVGWVADVQWEPTLHMPFLTARWENLVLLNYACPPALLEPLVPAGTELDPWEGQTLVSLVGFLFSDTRLLGVPVPFHRTFEEVNLRFYVRRPAPDHRRAVVFIRELVPRWAIAAVARGIYNEPYLRLPMRHQWSLATDGGEVRYGWTHRGADFELGARVSGAAEPPTVGSEAEFMTEHYWGYTRQRDGGTLEYQVEHPAWRVWTASDSWLRGPAAALYGPDFGALLSTTPRSAFVAVGSPVAVHHGRRLESRAG